MSLFIDYSFGLLRNRCLLTRASLGRLPGARDVHPRHHLRPLLRPAAGGDCRGAHFRAARGRGAEGAHRQTPLPAPGRACPHARSASAKSSTRRWRCGFRRRERDRRGHRRTAIARRPRGDRRHARRAVELEGLRTAEAGEFTRRAFENGKLDLTAVEGLADLVMAETEAQRRQAYRSCRACSATAPRAWRQQLIKALAWSRRASIFPTRPMCRTIWSRRRWRSRAQLKDEIAAALADGGRGERLRDGLVVAIAGPPNAGKSTLLNRIARREAAIVSPYAGTTRDVIEVHLDLGGYPVTLLDTAGIRETDDPVEMEGVRRARERAAEADLVLWVEDAIRAGGRRAGHCAGPGLARAQQDRPAGG